MTNHIKTSKMKVLYILHTNNWDGSAHSLLNMIHSLNNNVEATVLFRRKNNVYEIFRKEGINCIICPFINNIKKTNKKFGYYFVKLIMYCVINFFSLLYLYCKLYKKNINIIHSNSGVVSLGFALSRLINAKHVVHLREYQDKDFGLMPLTGWGKFYKNLNKADSVISITKGIYDYFKLAERKNTYYIWNAVLSKNKAQIQVAKEKFFLFCCAILHEAKGVDFCIDAFAKSRLYSKGYALYIIGKDEDIKFHNKLNSIISEYGIAHSVKFIGTQDDVKPFFLKASAFMMCSKNEGFGRVTAEAMFYGCPVICRNSGGSTEFITHRETGFLFNNITECINAMEFVITKDCSNIIHNAQQFAINNFSEEVYGEKILSVYNQLFK